LKDDLKHLHSGIFKAVGEIFENISERLLDIQCTYIFLCQIWYYTFDTFE